MRRITRLTGPAIVSVIPLAASAHEKWFVDPAARGEIPELFRTLTYQTWIAIGVTAALFAVCVVLDRWIRRMRATRRAAGRILKLYPWAPTILGVTTGVALGAFALDRAVLAPFLHAPDTTAGTVFVALEFVAAALLILGIFARAAAVIILALAAAGFAWFPFSDAVEQIHFLGIAVFLFAWGRGRLSLGSVFSRLVASAPSHLRPAAALALRVFLGLNILALALGKVLRPDLHLALMDLFPRNPLAIVHLVFPALTREWYLLLVALAEFLIGSLVLLGVLLRPAAALLAVTFLASAAFLPPADLVGHLPYVGAAVALAILGRSGEKEPEGEMR